MAALESLLNPIFYTYFIHFNPIYTDKNKVNESTGQRVIGYRGF